MKTTFSPRDAVPKPVERQFPIIIQGKGPKVTVYEDDDRGKPVYIVVYYAEGTVSVLRDKAAKVLELQISGRASSSESPSPFPNHTASNMTAPSNGVPPVAAKLQ